MRKYFLGCLAFVFMAVLMVSSPVHADGQKTILVLDASGSMWGQIDGKAKITIARDVIAGMVKDWPKDQQIGLMAYGHRTKGDCNDIEMLMPVGPLNQSAFNSAIKKLNPKGKTPLTAAVKLAAEKLKYTEEKATVILISDGKETCNADPCAVATELEKTGVDFTAHVIGFDVVGKKGIQQLQCLAKNTGGEYLTAKNATGLKKALDKAVKKVATGPIGHKFYVSLKKGDKPLTSISNYWYIYNAEVNSQGKRKEFAKAGSAQPLFSKLVTGKYQAVVKHGYAQAQTDFEVKGAEDSVVHRLSLNAGFAHLKVSMAEGKEPLGKISNYWYIYSTEVDELGKRRKLGSSGASQPTLILPQGKYHMVVNHGYGSAEGDIEVKAGESSDLSLVLNEGYARLKVSMAEGKEPLGKISNYWYIYSAEVDELGKRRKLGSSGASQPTLILPQGKYHMVVNHGYGSAEGDIEVKAGESSDLSLVLNEGYARLKVSLAEGKPALGSISNYWYIYRIDEQGNRKQITTNGAGQPTLVLPEGKYHAVVNHNHVSAEGDFKVKAGLTSDLFLILPSSK